MNLLITTLGTSWQIVPELYGFTNPAQLDLYRNRAGIDTIDQLRLDHAIEAVDAIWVITTEKMELEVLKVWAAELNVQLQILWPNGVEELSSADENVRMADVIYRAVLHGRAVTQGGKLYLSLAGGRKTMSAEMQQAGMLFGCDALLHVVARRCSKEQLSLLENSHQFLSALPPLIANVYQPLVIMDRCPTNAALSVEPAITAEDYPLSAGHGMLGVELYMEIRNRLKQAESLMFNFSLQISGQEKQTNFHGLYTLPPDRVRQLMDQRIATDIERQNMDIHWLRKLPKSDLHCHLGGVLNASEMIETAQSMLEQVTHAEHSDPHLGQRLKLLRGRVADNDVEGIRLLLQQDSACCDPARFLRTPRGWFSEEPIGVCAFLLAFSGNSALLDEVIFSGHKKPSQYHGIGIACYEPLGDLQGSGLLQAEQTLRTVCRILRRQTIENNVRYLELRCSPHNYTRGGMSARRVVEILLDELSATDNCVFRLLFIASRHRLLSEAYQHIELAEQLQRESATFNRIFVGFDLAGDESSRSPREMRSAFLPLLTRCIPVTIHAGEDQDVVNIWEAIYELNADRIGHGLTLGRNPELLQRFVERRIALEMCPSSNAQVVGYSDRMLHTSGQLYPLEDYLKAGLRVTVNTDNPGISRTNATMELYKAAAMSANGLTRWQILQLLRNGFQAAFCSLDSRRVLLRAAEKQIVSLLTNETGELV